MENARWFPSRQKLGLALVRRRRRERQGEADLQHTFGQMICLLVLVPSLQAPPQRRVFVQTATNMLPPEAPATFRAWPALNDEGTRKAVNAGRRFRLHLQNASAAEASGGDPTLELFQGDTLMNRFALALAR